MQTGTKPVPLPVSREKAEEVKSMYENGELSTWLKFYHLNSTEADDGMQGFNFTFNDFASQCGVATTEDIETPEFKLLRKCFDTPLSHNKVIELSYKSIPTYCKQSFAFVSNTETGATGLRLSYMEMSITQNSLIESDTYMSDPVSNPEADVLSTVGEDDKQNYFRYEAIKRLHQEGVIRPS